MRAANSLSVRYAKNYWLGERRSEELSWKGKTLLRSLRAPTVRDWQLTGLGLLVFAVTAVPLGFMTGVYRWAPDSDLGGLLRVALIALIAPAILEELVFRGPLVWLQSKRGTAPAWAIGLSLMAFIAWHPLNTVLLMPQAADLFTDWRFLVSAAWLGVIATILVLRTKSIWTAIVFHWVVVVGWKAFLGAPSFL